MSSYPVSFDVERAARFTRVQLLIRLAALMALAILGVSFGTVFWVGYLLLPIYAASRIASVGSAARYAQADGPRVMRVLHWYAAISSWAGLVTEALPAGDPAETVRVTLDSTPVASSPVAALLRILTGSLSALLLCFFGFIGVFVWIWAAFSIRVSEGVGPGAVSYLVGLQRWGMRLLVYQACLVDRYPPFSFGDGPPPAARNNERIVTV